MRPEAGLVFGWGADTDRPYNKKSGELSFAAHFGLFAKFVQLRLIMGWR